MDNFACNGNTSNGPGRPQLVVAGRPAARRRQMLASIDLNMLLTLGALLEHRNVTHAARHLGLSQPPVSRALTRLRGIFNNDLLVRGSAGMVPTPHAERLAKTLPTALDSIRGMVSRGFAQGEWRSTVRVAMPDHQAVVLLPLSYRCCASARLI